MKQFFTLLFVLSVFSDQGFSQSKTRYSYLTVTLNSRHDNLYGGRFLELVSDRENPKSAVIDSLVTYRNKPFSDTGPQFYYQKKDSSLKFFNYFRSVSECLEFIDDHDWQLFSIVPYTSSSNGTVSTEAVYYFRKER